MATHTDGIAMFMGGRWSRTINNCITFTEEHVPESQVQWFIDIVAYLQFITGQIVIPRQCQIDEMHATKVRNTKENSIVIYYFKTYNPPVLGGLSEGKESITPLTVIRNPYLWNKNYRVRGVYPRASKSFQDKRINLQSGIGRELGTHTEVQLLVSEILGKCGVLWLKLAA